MRSRHLWAYRHAVEEGARHVHIAHDHDSGQPGAIEHKAGGWHTLIARNPTVRRFEVSSPRIDPAHDGVTVAHLTDLHVKGEWSTRRIKKAVDVLNALEPDIVCLTGDYVRYSKSALPHLADVLKGFRSPVYATLGNHDHWLDAEGVTAALHRANVCVLSNEARVLMVNGVPLHIVGIDDRYNHAHWLFQHNGGVFLPPWGKIEQWLISVQHDEADIDRLIANFRTFAVAIAG